MYRVIDGKEDQIVDPLRYPRVVELQDADGVLTPVPEKRPFQYDSECSWPGDDGGRCFVSGPYAIKYGNPDH